MIHDSFHLENCEDGPMTTAHSWTLRRRRSRTYDPASVLVEAVEPRLLLSSTLGSPPQAEEVPITDSESQSVAPGNLLIYYAYPSGINGTFSVNGAATVFSQYDFVVLGGGLELESHPDHANTVAIMNHASTGDTLFFGYVTLGVSSQNFSQQEIEDRIDAWKAAGADGILFDEYGYDFGVTRARQNAAVDYAHSVGLPVIANGFHIADVFGAQVDPDANPTGEATHLTATDYYLYESYQVLNGSYVSVETWRAKADALEAVRETLPIQILSVTTTESSGFEQSQFDYAYWSAALEGHVGFGWGEASFSSLTASAPFRARPSADPGAEFTAALQGDLRLFARETDSGWIAVDPQTYQAGFNVVDFGDAPDGAAGTGPGNYRTTLADDGARHIVGGARLGLDVDFEAAPVVASGIANSTYGYGDNVYGADEDGVRFVSLWQSSTTQNTTASVNVQVSLALEPVFLSAWADFNGDGDFEDPGEQILTDLAVTTGDHLLDVTIPPGAAAGTTYVRFRLSSSAGLASTGLATDGEVEDYAVLILGPGSLTAIETAILSHRFPNGLLRSHNDPSFYDTNGQPWYIVDPYFSTFAVRALLAAADGATVDPFAVAADQLHFWLQNLQQIETLPEGADAIIPRLFVDQNGTLLGLNDTVTASDGTVYSPLTYGADADDSSLAMILSLAAEYHFQGGSDDVLLAPGMKAQLELVADSLVDMIESNGLTFAFRDPENPGFQYTLDNLEVWQALDQFARLERALYGDSARGDLYATAAATVRAGIEQHMIDPSTGRFRWFADGPTPDLTMWYPLVHAQAWPLLTDFLATDSTTALNLLADVDETWNGTDRIDWTARGDSAFLAWAAVQTGDLEGATQSLLTLLPWALQNTPPTAAVTIADLGFLLQSLLPAAENDAAVTAHDTAVNIPVLDNDFSITTPAAQLTVTLVSGPASGTVQIVDGSFVYTPDSGFSGDDAFIYKVHASDGGTRTATVTVHVNAIPVVTGDPGLSYTEGMGAVPIQPGLLLDDDEAAVTHATITLQGFVAGEDGLAFVAEQATMGNITVTGNSGGVLQLASAGGTATLEQWQAALRAVTYQNSSESPTGTTRVASFVVHDAWDSSPPLETAIEVTPVNDPPDLEAIDTTSSIPAGVASLLDANARFTDVDSVRFDGAVLTVEITAHAEPADQLQFRGVTRLIGITGANLTYRGTVIGTFAGGSGADPLVITFNGEATVSAVQTILRSVTLLTSESPTQTTRTVAFTLVEADAVTSNTAIQQITLTGTTPIPTEDASSPLVPAAAAAEPAAPVVEQNPPAMVETSLSSDTAAEPESASLDPRTTAADRIVHAMTAAAWDRLFSTWDGLFESTSAEPGEAIPLRPRRGFRFW